MRKLSKHSSEYQEAIETHQKQLQQVQNDIRAAIAAAGSHGSGSISGSHGSGNGRLRYRNTAAPFLPGIPTTPAVVTTGVLTSRFRPAPISMQPPAAR